MRENRLHQGAFFSIVRVCAGPFSGGAAFACRRLGDQPSFLLLMILESSSIKLLISLNWR